MKRKITGGLYLVIDPSLGLNALLPKIEKAIAGGVDVLQVWNNWANHQDKFAMINAVCSLANVHDIPVVINEEWELIRTTPLDGVHFDTIPSDLNAIRQIIARPFLCGITCGNDLTRVQWAAKNGLDYISFCSMFPSSSAGVCEIVKKETVQQARTITSIPIFLAGGITLENINQLIDTGMDGVALISAILKANDPLSTAKLFKEKLKTTNNEPLIN